MGEALERSALDRWRTEPTAFITEVMRNPEDGKPFELFPVQSEFLHHACARTEDGRLLYPEQALGAIKKNGQDSDCGNAQGKIYLLRRQYSIGFEGADWA